MRDGKELRCGLWQTAQAPTQGQVLLETGRGELIPKYSEVADLWAARGYGVMCYEHRSALPRRSHIESFDTYVDDMREIWERVFLKRQLPEEKTALRLTMAHSMGAHVTLRGFTDDVPLSGCDGLIVSAPFLEFSLATTPPWARGIVRDIAIQTLGRIHNTQYAPKQGDYVRLPFIGNPHTHDERRHNEWQDMQCALPPDQVTGGVTRAWVLAADTSNRKLRSQLTRLNVPTLALLTPDDDIVDGPAQELVPGIKVRFPGEKHELLRGPERVQTQLWQAVDRFTFDLKQKKRERLKL